jgi:hypothetical protein
VFRRRGRGLGGCSERVDASSGEGRERRGGVGAGGSGRMTSADRTRQRVDGGGCWMVDVRWGQRWRRQASGRRTGSDWAGARIAQRGVVHRMHCRRAVNEVVQLSSCPVASAGDQTACACCRATRPSWPSWPSSSTNPARSPTLATNSQHGTAIQGPRRQHVYSLDFARRGWSSRAGIF